MHRYVRSSKSYGPDHGQGRRFRPVPIGIGALSGKLLDSAPPVVVLSCSDAPEEGRWLDDLMHGSVIQAINIVKGIPK